MKDKDYRLNVLRTENTDLQPIKDRLIDSDSVRLLHSAIGISTEAGEFLDALKKHLFYGKNLDEVNIKEELGDILWYVAVACDVLGVELTSLKESNIAKLHKRYPGKFTKERALNRDIFIERMILEGSR